MKNLILFTAAIFAIGCIITCSSTVLDIVHGARSIFDDSKSGSLMASTGVAGLAMATWMLVTLKGESKNNKS